MRSVYCGTEESSVSHCLPMRPLDIKLPSSTSLTWEMLVNSSGERASQKESKKKEKTKTNKQKKTSGENALKCLESPHAYVLILIF